MKPLVTLLLSSFLCAGAAAQTTIVNGDFEAWGNSAPGVAAEPTNWYSNKSGSSLASASGAPQTCFQDNTIVHGGTSSVRIQNGQVPIVMTIVNGNVTTGVVSAPTINKADGYIGTRNYTDTADQRLRAFTGRPDSLVGWYQYTAGAATEKGKIRAILHTGDYYDPETASTYHPDRSANKIGEALFFTPMSNVSTWTRFSVPFTYTSAATPASIMINMTSAANQLTSVNGSKMWIDDLQAIYNHTGVNDVTLQENDVQLYAAEKTVFVNATKEMDNSTMLTICDMTGKTVLTKALGGSKFASFNLAYLPMGVYIYKVNNAAFTKTGKLSIQ